ncbi:PREDICTED: nuclear-interacting partner of ALK [Nanorana parkeri]|uniref:nuclear-interacting partner of ALK n=1 Tax=Nanorana parkeri TaxID=125878 RepID=UPI000854E694|nr:PREDICTED: nuclear-interacting partner of ALK [Nanorana parkeri]
MAAPCDGSTGTPLRSPVGTPGKVRELINEGIVNEDRCSEGRKDNSILSDENHSFDASADVDTLEATSKEAFFTRVESFSSLKWAGKPSALCPLACAKYGWSNVECDMLKCCSCNAYLCASLQIALDINKYKQRCVELQEELRTSHEKFCYWPVSPCPDNFWALLICEPSSVLSDFIERFQNLCRLELQLPALRQEDLKTMDLSEETVSLLLRLIEDELKPVEGRENSAHGLPSDSLQVQISACILALCGWNSSPSSGSLPLSIISCPRCMRKVGLWSFQQLESVDLDSSFGPPSTPVSPGEGHSDRTPLGVVSPNRRVTRSKDLEQSPMAAATQAPSGSSTGSSESDAVRSRPVTRSMGHGENSGITSEVQSSPQRKAKRPRLCSRSSIDSSPKGCFDPLNQHRSWCPWVTVGCADNKGDAENKVKENENEAKEIGWKEVLRVLLSEGKSRTLSDGDSTNVQEKSRKVFRIFRQWQASASS